MVAVDVVAAAEHRVVRPSGAIEENADGKRDGDHDSSDDSEDEDAAERGDRERDLSGADVTEAPD